MNVDELGWKAVSPTDASVVELRDHLTANNGITGLEIFTPDDIENAVRVFRRDGFVVVRDILDAHQIGQLRAATDAAMLEIAQLDDDRRGNRGSHRYSFGGSSSTGSQLHRPAWQMLLQLDTVLDLVAAIFESDDFTLRAASGDFCLAGATEYQPLHSDMRDFVSADGTPFSSFHDPRGHLTVRDLPCPYVCVNFMPVDITPLNGPTRQIPGSQHSRAPIPTLDQEPEWMRLSTVCPAPAGAIQIRDVRAWHGGTPNVSEHARAIPNLEFYAPWFREPTTPGISYDDHQQLTGRAQQITRFSVADSAADFAPAPTLRPSPGFR
ncbi:MAG: phytanoyl-CoA dioxygenase family protein [Actinomycetota bacterium]